MIKRILEAASDAQVLDNISQKMKALSRKDELLLQTMAKWGKWKLGDLSGELWSVFSLVRPWIRKLFYKKVNSGWWAMYNAAYQTYSHERTPLFNKIGSPPYTPAEIKMMDRLKRRSFKSAIADLAQILVRILTDQGIYSGPKKHVIKVRQKMTKRSEAF